jgi:hypothetical protein
LIQGSESYLKEQGLSFGQEPFTDLDILDAILNIDSCLRFQDALGPRKDLAKEIFDSVNRGSLLSKLQSSIYRVQDKMDRSKAQMFCYAYLSGSVKKVPSTGYTYLDNILKSPLATVFCKATREVKSGSDLDTVAKKYDVDRFEIAYILKRTGYEFD